jgi:hypothetical protein
MRGNALLFEKRLSKMNKGKKRLTTYRLKQWRTSNLQDVKRKRRASSGPTTNVGSIF